MFDKFGEFNSYEELNLAAEGFKKEGDKESLMELAKENGIDKDDVKDYLDGILTELVNPTTAALGRLEIVQRGEDKNEGKIERAMIKLIYKMTKTMCTDEEFAKSVMKKGKRIEKIVKLMKKGAKKHKEGNVGISAGTDEVMMEEKNEAQEELSSNLQKFMHQYFYENKEEYIKVHKAINKEAVAEKDTIEAMLDVISPSGIDTKMVRLPGAGRLMLSIQGTEQDLTLINIRSTEKEIYTWPEMGQAVVWLCRNKEKNAKKAWEEIYKEPFEVQEEKRQVAPVQLKEREELKEQNKADVPDNIQEDNLTASEEQIPGQMKAEDYPELMPDREQEIIAYQKWECLIWHIIQVVKWMEKQDIGIMI